MDRISPTQRSQLMASIRSRDTLPEMIVRRTLHKLGFRYVLHKNSLPGKPDLTFPSRKKIIFINGCFWHGHACKYGMARSKSNVDFWNSKISSNAARDASNTEKLRSAGWQVHVIWECEVRTGNWIPNAVAFLTEEDKWIDSSMF